MNQTICTTIGQALSLLAFGIGFAFGLYFCIEAIVAWFRRWGKWREARRLVREAEASEAMTADAAYADAAYAVYRKKILADILGEEYHRGAKAIWREMILLLENGRPHEMYTRVDVELMLAQSARILSDPMGGKK